MSDKRLQVSECEWAELESADAGFCTTCGDVEDLDHTEPDVGMSGPGYECHSCGSQTRIGLHTVLMSDLVDFVEGE